VGHVLFSLRVALAFIGNDIISVAVAIVFLPLVRLLPQGDRRYIKLNYFPHNHLVHVGESLQT
jgi:hypothetical protein